MTTAGISPDNNFIPNGKTVQEIRRAIVGVGLMNSLEFAIRCFSSRNRRSLMPFLANTRVEGPFGPIRYEEGERSSFGA
jgi:hypothetical protein